MHLYYSLSLLHYSLLITSHLLLVAHKLPLSLMAILMTLYHGQQIVTINNNIKYNMHFGILSNFIVCFKLKLDKMHMLLQVILMYSASYSEWYRKRVVAYLALAAGVWPSTDYWGSGMTACCTVRSVVH